MDLYRFFQQPFVRLLSGSGGLKIVDFSVYLSTEGVMCCGKHLTHRMYLVVRGENHRYLMDYLVICQNSSLLSLQTGSRLGLFLAVLTGEWWCY